MTHKTDVDENAEISRLRATVRQWKVDAARQGKALHLPVMPFLLRNIWTGALILFSLLTFSTFFISTVFQVSSTLLVGNEIRLTYRLGNNIYQLGGHLLGCSYVGAVCDYHGGETSV